MKKLLFTALAGIMLLAFTQCNSGTKEFQDSKKFYDKVEKAINKAKTCDELESCKETVFEEFLKENPDLEGKEYADDEKVTKEEQEKLKKLDKELDDLYKKKKEELCK